MNNKNIRSLIIAVVAVILFNLTAFAALKGAAPIKYYDDKGNQVVVKGMYYDTNGNPTYNSDCYYIDENGKEVSVGGCRAYYADKEGNFTPGTCYYDQNGNQVQRPAYRNNSQNQVNGNRMSQPTNRPAGGCCGGNL